MKSKFFKTLCLLLAIVAFSLMALGSDEEEYPEGKSNASEQTVRYDCETTDSGEIILPKNSDAYVSKDKFDVAKEFQDYGFTNITYSPQMDLITGWLTKDGSVVSVSIDGKSSFMKNAAFAPDAPVIITYHTFTGDYCTNGLKHTEEVDKGHPATCTEDGLTDGIHCSVCQKVLKEQTVIPAGHTVVIDKAVPATQTASGLSEGKHCSACGEVLVEQEVVYWSITVENNPEFAALFSKNSPYTKEQAEAFADKYSGKKIEFDGSLDNVSQKEGYDKYTWDYFLSYGDFAVYPENQIGPTFKCDGISNFSYDRVDKEPPYPHDNLHIVAEVRGYEDETGNILIILKSEYHRGPSNRGAETEKPVTELVTEPVTESHIYTNHEAEVIINEWLRTILESNQYSVSVNETLVSIHLYPEQSTLLAILASDKNNAAAVESWNQLVTKAKQVSNDILTVVRNNMNRKDLSVSLYYYSDINPDNVLLVVMNGVVYYDYANNIDLIDDILSMG